MPVIETTPFLDTKAADACVNLESRVETVKQTHRVKFLSTGVCLGLAVFVAAFLGFSAADILFKLSVGSRVFALFSTFIGVGVVCFWAIVRPWTRLGGSVQVARAVEGAYPELEEQLSTALEYGRDPRLAVKTSSPAMVGALIRQTAGRTEKLDFKRTIRWKQLVLAGILAFLFAAGLAAYAKYSKRLFAITFKRFLQPTADVQAPTLTEIMKIEPGNDEVPVESSVEIRAELAPDSKHPPTATLTVWTGDEKDAHQEDRVMDQGPDGIYRATLHRLLDVTRYKVTAHDAESKEFRVDVYKIPEINEFALRLEYPAYTGRATELLAPGTGDVRVLKGTTVHVDLKANTDLSLAKAKFKSGREASVASIDSADKRKASVAFTVDGDDEYQILIENVKHKGGTGSVYNIKALKDHPPKVTIKKPEKDLMVHRDQTVTIEVEATDDVGVTEIGMFHSLDMDEKRVLIKRPDPVMTRADGKLVWQLGNMGLKGGEVIAYYAYALDNDSVGGPKSDSRPNGGKMAKSDIHFLTVYDEQEFDGPQNPKKGQPTPQAVKQLDKLIDIQKKILKETFAQARQHESTEKPSADSEKAAASKTADGQKDLRGKVQDLIAKVKEELAKAEEPVPENGAGPKPPQGPGISEKELKHMESAMEKMTHAEDQLKKPDTVQAVQPETEALRHLSETRRLLLSDKEGDPRFKSAMNKQSKKKKKQDQEQQQEDQQQAKQELAEMPKMMDREKKLERELEELNERKKKNPPPPAGQPQSPEQKKEQDEQRRLQRESQDQLEKLAKESQERQRKLDQLAARNPELQPAADKMQEATDKLEQAAKEAQKQAEKNTREAQEKTRQAQNDTKDSQRSLRNAMEKQVRQELANLQKDAQDLAQRQQNLAEQAQKEQAQQQGKPEAGQKPEQGKPEQGKPDSQGKPEQGKPDSQGKPESGQPQQGKPDSQGKPEPGQGQPQHGQPDSNGQPEQSATASAQRMKGLGNEQRDIQNDLKELSERIDAVASKAAEKNLAGAKELAQAQAQAKENSPASQSAQKSRDSLGSAKSEEAQREANKAAKALEQLAHSITDAVQKTSAGDMNELAGAMKKLKEMSKEQGEINKDLGQKSDSGKLGEREQNISDAAKELAQAAENVELLRQSGNDKTAKEQLEEASRQADAAANALKGQDPVAAKTPADKTDKALSQALNEMERAAGKTLEEKAREAMAMARAARENQEKAASALKEMPEGTPEKPLSSDNVAKRDEAAAKENQAARDAKRLEHALDGLQELAKDANPAAAEAAKDARDTTQQAELPKTMEELAKGVEQIGNPNSKKSEELSKENKNLTARKAAEKGDELAQVVKKVEQSLNTFVAEAKGSQLDRLKAMEQEAREAAQKAKDLAAQQEAKPNPGDKQNPADKQNPEKGKPETAQNKQPGDKGEKGEPKNPDQAQNKTNDSKPSPDGKQPGKEAQADAKTPSDAKEPGTKPGDQKDAMKQLEQALKHLEPKVARLEPTAPEIAKMKEAMAELQKAQEPTDNPSSDPSSKPAPSEHSKGGPALKRASQAMDDVAGGLVNRIERLLRAREVKPDEDEGAPKEYQTLVDKYYRALSEDVEEEKH